MAAHYIWQTDTGKQILEVPRQGIVLTLFLSVDNQT